MPAHPNHHPRVSEFLDFLNTHDDPPSWAVAAVHADLVDLGIERHRLALEMTDQLEQIRATQEEIVNDRDRLEAEGRLYTAEEYVHRLAGDLNAAQTRAGEIADEPGRYFLATGEIIHHHPDGSYHSGWWSTNEHHLITTPAGERLHEAGIDPTAGIHPTADIHPTARIEHEATIAAGGRIGAYAHIGREASVGPNTVIQQGARVGPLAEIWNRSWIGEGAHVGARSVVGNQTTIGNGSTVTAQSEIAPHSRIGANHQVSAQPARDAYRGMQIANSIERLMSYDRE